MPRRFNKYSKRSRKGGSSWYNKKYSAVQLASKAWQAAKYVKSLINVEKKFCDTTDSTTLATAGAVDIQTNISEGVDYNQREGLSVKAVSLYLRGTLTLMGTAPVPTNVRLMLVCDLDNTGTSPSVTDVIESATVNSPLNHTNGKRFSVLWDKNFSLSPNGTEAIHIKKFMKMQNHVRFSNATTGLREGHVYLIYLTDANPSSTSNIAFVYYDRIRYIDN